MAGAPAMPGMRFTSMQQSRVSLGLARSVARVPQPCVHRSVARPTLCWERIHALAG